LGAGVDREIVLRVEEALFLLMVCLPLLALVIGRCFENSLLSSLEAFERSMFHGAAIEVDTLVAQVCVGVVAAERLTIQNPDGYQSPYLLSVGKVHMDLDMGATLCSCCRRIVVERLDLAEVDVIVEHKGGTTNLQVLLDCLEAPAWEYEGLIDRVGGDEKGFAFGSKDDKGREVMIIIHEVTITDVGMRHQSAGLGGLGIRVDMCDLHYDDLAKELGCRPGHAIAKVLMGSFLKSIVSNVAGKSVGDHWL